jgi:two-component system, chemotaxis family, protein-glutamate methylesterase/glutaminase
VPFARRCRFEVVTMVASLGGLAAVTEVLRALPADFPPRVLITQHGRSEPGPNRLARLLASVTALPVDTATTGSELADGPGVTVIPNGHCATVDEARSVSLSQVEPRHCGDVLLASLAPVLGPAAIAVVLTGMLDDGARGVRAIKRHGGRVFVQDPATAQAPGMPSAALATGCVDFALPLHRIAQALVSLTMAPGGAELLTVPTPAWARLHA